MAMYWSEASTLNAKHAPTVRPTKPSTLFTPPTKAWVNRASMPVACNTAPNVMAHTINHTVLSMPAMPLELRSSSANSCPVAIDTSRAMACMEAM